MQLDSKGWKCSQLLCILQTRTVYCIRCGVVCKIGFINWNAKIALLRSSLVVTYYIKLFRTGADRHNGILMSLLLLVAETASVHFKLCSFILVYLTRASCSGPTLYQSFKTSFQMILYGMIKSSKLLDRGISNILFQIILDSTLEFQDIVYTSLALTVSLFAVQKFPLQNRGWYYWELWQFQYTKSHAVVENINSFSWHLWQFFLRTTLFIM